MGVFLEPGFVQGFIGIRIVYILGVHLRRPRLKPGGIVGPAGLRALQWRAENVGTK